MDRRKSFNERVIHGEEEKKQNEMRKKENNTGRIKNTRGGGKSGRLFSIWNILMLAIIISLVIATVVLRILGISPIFLVIFLLIQFYLLFTGKSTKEIVKKIEERLEKYEGEQLDFMAQVSIAKSFYDIFIRYKFVRYVIVLALSSLTIVFAVTWLLFGIIVAILFIVLIILTAAWWIVRQDWIEFLKRHFTGTIEKDPPHVGLLTVWGEKKEIVLKEGYALKFPPVIGFIPIKVQRETLDLEDHSKKPVKVISKDNVTVRLNDVTLWYAPDSEDAKRLIDFVTIGKHNGVEDALEDLILAHLRQFARKLYVEDSEEDGEVIEGLLSAQKRVTNEIIQRITGVSDNEEIKKNLKNGMQDDELLGIKVFRFSIGEAKPEGEYAKNLEQLAKEKLQRTFEIFEANSEGLRAITYFMSSRGKDISKMAPEDIESYISKKAEKDPAFKKEFMQFLTLVLDYKTDGVIPGLGDRLREGGSIPLDVIGGLISGLLEKPSGEKKPREEKGIKKNESETEEN